MTPKKNSCWKPSRNPRKNFWKRNPDRIPEGYPSKRQKELYEELLGVPQEELPEKFFLEEFQKKILVKLQQEVLKKTTEEHLNKLQKESKEEL